MPKTYPPENPTGRFGRLSIAAVQARARGKLTESQFLMLSVLSTWADANGLANPTIDQISRRFRRTDRQCQRLLNQLAALGWMKRSNEMMPSKDGVKRLRVVYHLSYPPLVEDDDLKNPKRGVTSQDVTPSETLGVTSDDAPGDINETLGVTSSDARGDIARLEGTEITTNSKRSQTILHRPSLHRPSLHRPSSQRDDADVKAEGVKEPSLSPKQISKLMVQRLRMRNPMLDLDLLLKDRVWWILVEEVADRVPEATWQTWISNLAIPECETDAVAKALVARLNKWDGIRVQSDAEAS